MQAGDGSLRAPSIAPQGGVVFVDVGGGFASVEVTVGSSGATWSYPVPPGKRVAIPVPAVPPGATFVVSVGRGLGARAVLVEVVVPVP